MVDNKLKIRIQIKQAPSASDDSHQEDETPLSVEGDPEQYPLDWTKILLAALLLVSVFGFIGYSLWGSDSDEPVTEKIAESPAVSGAELKNNLPETNKVLGDSSNASSASIDIPVAISNDKDTHKALVKSNPVPVPAREKPAPTAPPNKKVIIIPAKKPQKQPQQQSKKASQTIAEQLNQTYVARALLTHTIEDKEPKDSIDSVILKNGEAKTIYFYLHLINLEDKTITICWYHNGKQDSKLTMKVQNKNWRTYASKLLNKKRQGSWRVELADESNNTLAVKNFTVIQS